MPTLHKNKRWQPYAAATAAAYAKEILSVISPKQVADLAPIQGTLHNIIRVAPQRKKEEMRPVPGELQRLEEARIPNSQRVTKSKLLVEVAVSMVFFHRGHIPCFQSRPRRTSNLLARFPTPSVQHT